MVKSLPSPTSEQLKLVSSYKEKWKRIATSTNRINRSKAEDVIEKIYKRLDRAVPILLFADSPFSGTSMLQNLIERQSYSPFLSLSKQFQRHLKEEITLQITGYSDVRVYPAKLKQQPNYELQTQLYHQLHMCLSSVLWAQAWRPAWVTFQTQAWNYSNCYIAPEYWACDGCYLDWLCNCLNCEHDVKLWKLFETLLTECGWIFPFEEVCIISDHPTYVNFDAKQRLHAEGKPALAFSDGFCVYAYCGVVLPAQYGKLLPEQWRPEWYTKEKKKSIKKILLQELPPNKIERKWLLSESDIDIKKLLVQKLGIKIQFISEFQVTALDVYRKKWRAVAFQTTPIDRQKATEAIHQFYTANKSAYEPVVVFADSPYTGRKLVKQKCRGQSLNCKIGKNYGLYPSDRSPIDNLWKSIIVQLSETVFKQLCNALIIKRSWNLDYPSSWVQPEELSSWFSLFDFCISILKCVHDSELWTILQAVFTECGWFYPAQRICIVCDRPIELSVDDRDRLHNETKPAIIYSDGYKLRARHGLHPKQYFNLNK